MNIHNWRIFNKLGSLINWTPDPLIQLLFDSPTGKGAEGFLVTDPSGRAISAEITNGGYLYDDINLISLSYAYAFESGTQILSSAEASINIVDVSIFNPEGKNAGSISSISIDLSTNFVYPSATYAAAVFLNPVSQGLIETEHLFIIEEDILGNFIRPYDASNSTLLMVLEGEEDEIKLFSVNEDTAEISWSDSIVFDLNEYAQDTPLQINIGFRAEVEGIFERILRIYHIADNIAYTIADIVINAESISEDERFRTLLSNFGAPDPKDIKDIFKQTDINEDLPDWEVLNYKSKHMILEHDKIIPFIGTYKGLINAIKWLGYDDIYVREWFMNVKEHTKLSLVVPYDAKDRTQTILMFNEDERKVLKKLNQLSLNYCLTRETGNLDVWGTPETENCYSYNLKEVFIKLLGLKDWLEKNIIGINCRITDITGEGIYFERVQNLIYATDNIGFNYSVEQQLTPYGVDGNSELVTGDASVRLSFFELTHTKIGDLPYRPIDFAQSAWNPNDPSAYNWPDPSTPYKFVSLDDPSYLADPSSFLLIGAPLSHPFLYVTDIMYRLSVEKDFAGTLGESLVTNPLFVLDNTIRYYNIFDSSSVFYDTSTSLTIYLETAFLRDPCIDEWVNSIAYSIYPNPSANGFIMESSMGDILQFSDYPSFNPDTSSLLQYAVDDNYKVPLLSMINYRTMDASNINTIFDRTYYLDILDGKLEMQAGMIDPVNSSDNLTVYLNFNYDTSLDEQKITVNAVYSSPRMRLNQIDPSTYYWANTVVKNGGNDPSIYLIDNSIYTMHVNHIGDYNIEIFAWDDYNTLFYNSGREKYPVWIKLPTLYTLIDQECNSVCPSAFMSLEDVSTLISKNPHPIYDRVIPLQGLTVEIDSNNRAFIKVPSITFFQDLPVVNSINRFFNLTERVINITDPIITIDPDFQKFYEGDDIMLVKFDKGEYSLLKEVSSYITSISGNDLTLDQIPLDIYIDSSTEVYILNNTLRDTFNVQNVNDILTLDVSGYEFLDNQLVGVIVTDGSSGFSWGSSYRVTKIDGSTHTFDAAFPDLFINNSSKYIIQVKHAFSTYSDLIMITESATEAANEFSIYVKDSQYQEYYLDNTFMYINILFDQDKINEQWYESSDNLINDTFYYYSTPINVDVSTLVILRALYEPSTYLLNQKNVWQVTNHDTGTLLFKVFNDSVPYIFDEEGTYNVECTSYDSFGNAITKKYEGLIKVI